MPPVTPVLCFIAADCRSSTRPTKFRGVTPLERVRMLRDVDYHNAPVMSDHLGISTSIFLTPG
jgi:hypothetical protein